MLTQAITTKHSIHPSFGTAQFFEYVLKNPYNTEHTIVVNCEDPELMWVFSFIIVVCEFKVHCCFNVFYIHVHYSVSELDIMSYTFLFIYLVIDIF